jgi:hypothetical protein
MVPYTVIPATLEAEVRGSQFEVCPGKVSARPYLKNKLEKEK